MSKFYAFTFSWILTIDRFCCLPLLWMPSTWQCMVLDGRLVSCHSFLWHVQTTLVFVRFFIISTVLAFSCNFSRTTSFRNAVSSCHSHYSPGPARFCWQNLPLISFPQTPIFNIWNTAKHTYQHRRPAHVLYVHRLLERPSTWPKQYLVHVISYAKEKAWKISIHRPKDKFSNGKCMYEIQTSRKRCFLSKLYL